MQSLLSTITRGKSQDAPRIVLYGMEGIGKSTFAANFPNPVFVQTEDGLGQIDCAKFPLCQKGRDALDQLTALANEPNDFQTVVLDSLDWLERLIWDDVCAQNKVDSIEHIGYGKGYVMALTSWRIILDVLTELHNQRKIVLLLAHAVAEDYTDPEVTGLKRFTPRLHKTARSLIAEYVDLVLLATRKFGAATGESGNNPRIVRTEPSPYQVAKSRYAIPAELPLDAGAVLAAIKNACTPNPKGNCSMKKLVIVVALIGATFFATESANAFGFRFFRCRYYPIIPDNDASCNSCPSGPSQGRLINPVEPGEYLPTPSDLSAIERELIAEAIRVRGRVLAIDRLCCQRSRRNSDAQASYCQLGHFTGSAYEIAGVGYGSPAAAVQGWLNSPAHRAILLRADFTKVGAAVRRGRDGRLYWTMNFSR